MTDESQNTGRLLAFHRDEVSIAQILHDRALLLAKPAGFETQDTHDTGHHIVCFRAGESVHGVELRELREIRQAECIAVVPCTPKFLLGLIQVHGDITGVIDLVEFFGFKRTEHLPHPTTVLVIDAGGASLGVAADELLDVRTLGRDEMRPVPATVNKTERDVTRGVTPDGVMIIHGEALAQHQRLRIGAI